MNSNQLYAQMLELIDQENVASAIDTFRASLSSPDPYVRWAGIKGCGVALDTQSIEDLVSFLGSDAPDLGDTDQRRVAVWSLAKFGFDTIFPLIERDSRLVQSAFAEDVADLIGELHDSRGLELLSQLIARNERNVTLWASLSAAKIGESSLPVIERNLSGNPSLETTFYLLDALSKIGTPAALALRKNSIQESKHHEVRAME